MHFVNTKTWIIKTDNIINNNTNINNVIVV